MKPQQPQYQSYPPQPVVYQGMPSAQPIYVGPASGVMVGPPGGPVPPTGVPYAVAMPAPPGVMSATMQGMMPMPYPVPCLFAGAPYPDTPMKALDFVESAWVSQKAQYLEAMTGCEFENKYRVYGGKEKGGNVKKDKDDKLFKCKEHSTFCQRQCVW